MWSFLLGVDRLGIPTWRVAAFAHGLTLAPAPASVLAPASVVAMEHLGAHKVSLAALPLSRWSNSARCSTGRVCGPNGCGNLVPVMVAVVVRVVVVVVVGLALTFMLAPVLVEKVVLAVVVVVVVAVLLVPVGVGDDGGISVWVCVLWTWRRRHSEGEPHIEPSREAPRGHHARLDSEGHPRPARSVLVTSREGCRPATFAHGTRHNEKQIEGPKWGVD